MNLKPAPYCAEFQVAVLDWGARQLIVSPRRPMREHPACIKKLAAAHAFVAVVALYGQWDEDVYEQRRWLEGRWALGCKLAMKKRKSKRYKKLYDCLIFPSRGWSVRQLS